MIPVVTPAEMREVDAASPEPVEVLIERAGAAVARHARAMLGGTYGRVVSVIAGPGNNGADGRVAADHLRRAGVSVRVFDAADCPGELGRSDLVIDAAYGTGGRVGWSAPGVGEAAVLAVDIPSGLDALTGAGGEGSLRADRTVTFQAFKPGLLLGRGPELCGDVHVVDLALDVGASRCHVVGRDDVATWWPTRPTTAHKWHGAVRVVAGSAEMPGAAELCVAAAARAGAGLVSLSSPGAAPRTRSEIVQRHVESNRFASVVRDDLHRFASLVIGPGLGRDAATAQQVRVCVADADLPVVVDGDAITAVAADLDVIRNRRAATVITPHDGEFETLTGARPSADRIESARTIAADLAATVLLKGPTTVIADPDGTVLLVDHGDARLATAGTGDVLAGVLAAALAGGVRPLHAAAAAAWLHADAARRGPRRGLLAGDVVDLLGASIDDLAAVTT